MSDELESQVNEILLKNGWDYDARKRVTFMLRNKRPTERSLDDAIKAVHARYGTDLRAFFADALRDTKARAESRRLGGA